jgi:polyisoprenoid-binding protein YceI
MKRIFLFSGLISISLIIHFTSFEWKINTEDVRIHFNLPHQPAKGTIGKIQASIKFNPLQPAASVFKAKLDVLSLKTENPAQTASLHSEDYFDPKRFPFIHFESSGVSRTDSGFLLKGKLTIKETTEEVLLPFTFREKGSTGMFQGRLHIYCSRYGLLSRNRDNPTTLGHVFIEVPVKRMRFEKQKN